MNIFFDLDGTLLDSRYRLYYLFQDLVPESSLSFESYWNYKMNKVSHKELLNNEFGYGEKAFKFFEENWMQKIESPEWLVFDKPFVGVLEFLKSLKANHKIYVVTARQFRDVAIQQLNNLGFSEVFDDIFVTGQKKEKYELIKESIITSSSDWLIGDTGKDIQTGKLLGMRTVGVLSGFLNEKRLREYNPDLIVENVNCLNFNN
ncbi:HAD family hydrolase [Pedobacter miscanthi]|uniref:HAD family hydrolase n=1 Tax=Pedobacter miscanthi TaxID=2259170 RepID=A0A366KPE9_9SPHI|nr:HAD hydrolase-like protein [Pedobacter miscanthi]RBQ03557.1 HAD family hydrolase [Pedobacter miscanthi]